MLTALRLKNWKSHQDTNVSFAPGVNAIVGINGAGKCSILQAVSFALFGTFPQLQKKAVALEDLVTRKPVQKESAIVELEFRKNEKVYTVSRTIAKQGKRFATTEAELRCDGTLQEANPAAVTRLVESVLQMDYDLFLRAVYAEQNGIDAFLRLARGARKEEVDSMLQLERYERARAAAVSLSNQLARQAEDKRRFLAGLDQTSLTHQKEEVEDNLRTISTKRTAAEARLTALTSERQQAEAAIAREEQALANRRHAEQKLAALTASIEELELACQAVATKTKGTTEDQLRQESVRCQQSLDTIRHQLAALEEKTDAARNQLAAANATLAALKEAASRLDQAGAACPVCDTPLPEEKKGAIRHQRSSQQQSAREEASTHAQAITALREEQSTLQAEESRLRQQLNDLPRLLSLFEDAAHLRARLAAQREERTQQEAALPPAVDERALQDQRHTLAGLAQEAGAAASDIRAMNASLSEKLLAAAQLEKQLAYMEKEGKEAQRQAVSSGQLSLFARILSQVQDALRTSVLSAVNNNLSTIWPVLYPYGDFTDLRLDAEEGEYILRLKERNRWVAADIVSGGERSVAALALRMAFSLTFLPHVRWLILDEPTHNLDAAAVSRLAGIFQEGILSFADQVFLVTHEERLAFGHTIRLHRDKAADLPTVLS